MRNALIVAAMVLQTSAWAVPAQCSKTAKTAVLKQFGGYFFQKGVPVRKIQNVECQALKSKARQDYVACDVYGDGIDMPGAVTFRVLENAACTRAFRAFLTQEE